MKLEEALAILVITAVVLIGIVWFFYTFWYCCPPPQQYCEFPAGIACVDYKINQMGNLTLMVLQHTGHNITITGINCTAEENSAQITKRINVQINNDTMKRVFNGEPCYLANGDIASGSIGSYYRGKLFIKYIETDTGMNRSVIGNIAVEYE